MIVDETEATLSSHLDADIRALAAIERPSASPGEEAAARWVKSRFGEMGLAAEVEPFRFNPDYWTSWGLHGLLAAAASGLALLGRRMTRTGALLSALTTASLWGELTTEFYLLRRLLATRNSYNVLARLPNPDASRLLIVSAHHDAPHCGLVFHPAVPRAMSRLLGPSPEAPSPLRLPFAASLAVTTAALGRTLGIRGGLTRRPLLLGGISAWFSPLSCGTSVEGVSRRGQTMTPQE